MKATVPYIEQKFEEFNRQMFGGKLPKIPVELSDAKTFLGQCVFRTRRKPFGKTEDVSSHGPLFLSIMNEINRKFGRNLTVSHKSTKEQREQLQDKGLDSNIQLKL